MDSDFEGIKIRERKNPERLESNACRKTIIFEDRAHLKWSARTWRPAPAPGSRPVVFSCVELNASHVGRTLPEGRREGATTVLLEYVKNHSRLHVCTFIQCMRMRIDSTGGLDARSPLSRLSYPLRHAVI